VARLPKNLTFEDAMTRLEEIVEAMESGEIGIEDSIQRYEEATTLYAHCTRILTDAELRIRRIQTQIDGSVKLEPFEEPAAAPDDADDAEEPDTSDDE